MGKIAKLVMVTSNNNNKYYDMVENNNVINVTYGRVGQGAMEATYPIGKWNSLYKSKIRKGYKDLTELREVESTIINFDDIDDDIVNKLITELQAFANRSIQQNYTVSSEVVTQKQIDAAQQLLNEITDIFGKRKINLSLIDNKLLELYQVIPRKMKVVNDYLTIGLDQQEINLLIANEQATLDVMKGQVSVNSAQKTNTIENKQTILEAMGIEIYAATEKEIDRIKKELGNAKDRFVRAYSVVNKNTFLPTKDSTLSRYFLVTLESENASTGLPIITTSNLSSKGICLNSKDLPDSYLFIKVILSTTTSILFFLKPFSIFLATEKVFPVSE